MDNCAVAAHLFQESAGYDLILFISADRAYGPSAGLYEVVMIVTVFNHVHPDAKGINTRRPAACSLHRLLASPRFSPGCPSAEVSLSYLRFIALPVAIRHFKAALSLLPFWNHRGPLIRLALLPARRITYPISVYSIFRVLAGSQKKIPLPLYWGLNRDFSQIILYFPENFFEHGIDFCRDCM